MIQEIHFVCDMDVCLLSSNFFLSIQYTGIGWLDEFFFFTDEAFPGCESGPCPVDAGKWMVVADMVVKSGSFRVFMVYAPDHKTKSVSYLRVFVLGVFADESGA